MKRWISCILLVLLALQAFYPITIYSYYYANKARIATELCENKLQPQLGCKGKCFLKKQLQKAEQQDTKKEHSTAKFDLLFFILSAPVAGAEWQYNFIATNYFAPRQDNYYFNYHAAPFHPPRV